MFLKIKEIRKEKKISQKYLADKSDISVRMLSDYENNSADITLRKLQNIADALECSVSDLINETKDNKSNPEEIIELQKKIIALQEENTNLQKENFKLKEENLKLKVALGSSDATDRTKQKSA